MSASEEDTLVGEFKELASQVISRLATVDTAYAVFLLVYTAYAVFLYLEIVYVLSSWCNVCLKHSLDQTYFSLFLIVLGCNRLIKKKL